MNKKTTEISKKELEVLDFGFPWSEFFSFWALFLIYSIVLGFLGFFNWIFLIPGFLILGFLLNPFFRFFNFCRSVFGNIDILRFILILFFIGWLGFLLFFSPPPYFSGRDEGSYANAAIQIAKNGSVFSSPEILGILNQEGAAHQSLNFPGFVISQNRLLSQFSPAYSVFLALFYKLTDSVFLWSLANGLLILGGALPFYFILRYFLPRFLAFSGFLILFSHFLFIWFPRFTLSENLTFCLLWNLIFFILIFYFTEDSFIRKNLILPLVSLSVLLPLTRPEGIWLVLAFAFLAFLFRRRFSKEIFDFGLKNLLSLVFGFSGAFLTIYVLFLEFPVYKRLFKDWIKWNKSEVFYENLKTGQLTFDNFFGAISSSFPSLTKFVYLVQVEWKYGILFFGFFGLLALFILIFRSKQRFFNKKEERFLKILLFLISPFFISFVSPQISGDHPWMLRRFLVAVLPAGILLAIFIIYRLGKKMPQKMSFLVPIFLGLLFLPSFEASSSFLTIKTGDGRNEALEKLGEFFKKEDFVFLHRESSGDGWQMFSGPLMSVYSLNSAYIFLPDNVTQNKKNILERWYQGKRSYVVLPEGAYDYEHKLKKTFNLTLEKEISFTNDQLKIETGVFETKFPLLYRKEHKLFVYLVSPK